MKYLFFDTETTGLPRDYHLPATDTDNWPHLVQLAWVLSEEGKIIEQAEHIIKPRDFIIPDNAARVHGIDTAKALREGQEIEVALKRFLEVVNNEDIILVAHNLHFDKHIIGAELVRLELSTRLWQLDSHCTMVSQTKFFGKYPKLADLYFHLFAKNFANAHSALADTMACHDCFFELKTRGRI